MKLTDETVRKWNQGYLMMLEGEKLRDSGQFNEGFELYRKGLALKESANMEVLR